MWRRSFILSMMLIAFSFLSSAESRALLVGIGKYDRVKTGWAQIHGDNDVELLRQALAKKGFNDICTLTNHEATKARIERELQDLASRSEP